MGNIDRIVLIGFSGTGKTSVARSLAERLGWSVADSDLEIERHWGATIPIIFRDHGESAFRSSERAILQQLLARDQVVIATGGGARRRSSCLGARNARQRGNARHRARRQS